MYAFRQKEKKFLMKLTQKIYCTGYDCVVKKITIEFFTSGHLAFYI